MDSWTRRRATWAVSGALVAVTGLGAVLGTRDVAADLEPRVRDAVLTADTGPLGAGRLDTGTVGVEVEGREVRLDLGSTDPEVERRVVAAVRSVRGVRSVEVLPSGTRGTDDREVRDIDLRLEVDDRAVRLTTAVPTRELARAIEERAAQVRGLPVAVGLSVDPTSATPRWWPGLGRVLDATAPVADLTLVVEAGRLVVTGRTASRAGAERVRDEVAAVGLFGAADLDVDLDVGLDGISDAAAATVETAEVEFAVGSSSVGPEARADLDAVARAVTGSDVVLDVLGHAGPTDPEQAGRLARVRADVVRDYLVARGVPAAQVVVTAVGADADRGVDPLAQRYRRVDFRLEERD